MDSTSQPIKNLYQDFVDFIKDLCGENHDEFHKYLLLAPIDHSEERDSIFANFLKRYQDDFAEIIDDILSTPKKLLTHYLEFIEELKLDQSQNLENPKTAEALDTLNRIRSDKNYQVMPGRILYSNNQETIAVSGQMLYCGQENYGTFYHADGSIYKGQIKDGKPDGSGELTTRDGTKYIGDWKDGKKNGEGKYFEYGQLVYEGNYKDDEFHGYGILHQTLGGDPRIYQCNWQDGKKISGSEFITRTNPSSRQKITYRLSGNWQNDLKEGLFKVSKLEEDKTEWFEIGYDRFENDRCVEHINNPQPQLSPRSTQQLKEQQRTLE